MWWLLDLLFTFRPKNFQVKRFFKYDHDDIVPVESLLPHEQGHVDYYFGGNMYTHIGTWPLQDLKPRFTVPIQYAVFVNRDTGQSTLCTDHVKRYMYGPTDSRVPVPFHKYVPVPYVRFYGHRIKLGIKWKLYRKMHGTLYICNILGQVTSRQV